MPATRQPDRHDDLIECRQYIKDQWSGEIAGPINDDRVANERAVIAYTANRWAERNGYDRRVTVSDVERIEPQAMGHSDYVAKLSLYVAELIVYGQHL